MGQSTYVVVVAIWWLGPSLCPIKSQSLCFFHGPKSFKTIMGLKDSKFLSHSQGWHQAT